MVSFHITAVSYHDDVCSAWGEGMLTGLCRSQAGTGISGLQHINDWLQ